MFAKMLVSGKLHHPQEEMLEFSCFFFGWVPVVNLKAGNLFVKINEFFAPRIPKIRFELVLLETHGVSPSYSICRTGNAGFHRRRCWNAAPLFGEETMGWGWIRSFGAWKILGIFVESKGTEPWCRYGFWSIQKQVRSSEPATLLLGVLGGVQFRYSVGYHCPFICKPTQTEQRPIAGKNWSFT